MNKPQPEKTKPQVQQHPGPLKRELMRYHMNKSITVPFHGNTLYVIDNSGQPVVPMKPVVEGMGLDWGGQHKKIAANGDRWGISVMEIPSQGGMQETACIPLRKLPGWLMTVQPSRVKDPEVRARVIQYQEECDDVLWRYWNEGVAVNHRRLTGLTPAQQRHIQTIVNELAKYPGNSYARLYSGIKDRFGVGSYKDVPADRYPELCNFLGRKPLEGEWVPKDTGVLPTVMASRNNLYVMCKHVQSLAKVWKEELEPALRALGSPLAGELHDHVSTAAVMARTLHDKLQPAFAEEERSQQAWRDRHHVIS